jgi:hypothetical protein
MRTFVACLVLAAAVATPGIVVAATSSEHHGSPFVGTSSAIATPVQAAPYAPGPINPVLRPSVNAVKAAFAAKGVELTVEPLGGEAAEAFTIDPSSRCPTVISFQIGDHGSRLVTGACSSSGSVQTNDGVTIVYMPASVGPIVDEAVARLPG